MRVVTSLRVRVFPYCLYLPIGQFTRGRARPLMSYPTDGHANPRASAAPTSISENFRVLLQVSASSGAAYWRAAGLALG